MMSRAKDEEYTFVCPECGETLEVNDSMREALIEEGCVICGGSLSSDAFTSVTPADSR